MQIFQPQFENAPVRQYRSLSDRYHKDYDMQSSTKPVYHSPL